MAAAKQSGKSNNLASGTKDMVPYISLGKESGVVFTHGLRAIVEVHRGSSVQSQMLKAAKLRGQFYDTTFSERTDSFLIFENGDIYPSTLSRETVLNRVFGGKRINEVPEQPAPAGKEHSS